MAKKILDLYNAVLQEICIRYKATKLKECINLDMLGNIKLHFDELSIQLEKDLIDNLYNEKVTNISEYEKESSNFYSEVVQQLTELSSSNLRSLPNVNIESFGQKAVAAVSYLLLGIEHSKLYLDLLHEEKSMLADANMDNDDYARELDEDIRYCKQKIDQYTKDIETFLVLWQRGLENYSFLFDGVETEDINKIAEIYSKVEIFVLDPNVRQRLFTSGEINPNDKFLAQTLLALHSAKGDTVVNDAMNEYAGFLAQMPPGIKRIIFELEGFQKQLGMEFDSIINYMGKLFGVDPKLIEELYSNVNPTEAKISSTGSSKTCHFQPTQRSFCQGPYLQ